MKAAKTLPGGGGGNALAVASEYDLEDNGGDVPVLYAMWRAIPVPLVVAKPVAPQLTKAACDVNPTVILPTTEGVLYTQKRSGSTVTVTAKPAEGYEFEAGATSEWKLDVTAEPCEKSDDPPKRVDPPKKEDSPKKETPRDETALAATGGSGAGLPIALLGLGTGALVLLASARARRVRAG